MFGDKCTFVCDEDYETSDGAQNGEAVCEESINGFFEFKEDIGCYLIEKKSGILAIVLSIFGSVFVVSLAVVLFLYYREKICSYDYNELPIDRPNAIKKYAINKKLNNDSIFSTRESSNGDEVFEII
ncbi:hypothetical protein MHBO_004745 [Bonamia ostreae]|uniref:Uncharacterized protein n=1 Tax=Bonamia ostreae TaxID=126728 RepID=A0ABV2AU75_9EUKA